MSLQHPQREMSMQGKQAKIVSPTQERAILGSLATTRAPRQCASGSAVLQACSRPPSGSDGSPGFDAARRLIGIVLSNQGNTAGGKPGGGGSFALSSSLLSTL